MRLFGRGDRFERVCGLSRYSATKGSIEVRWRAKLRPIRPIIERPRLGAPRSEAFPRSRPGPGPAAEDRIGRML